MTLEADAIQAAVWAVRHDNIRAAVAVLTVAAERIQAKEDDALDARLDAMHGPGAAAALDRALSDGTVLTVGPKP